MIISSIVAVGKRNQIGLNNALPWHFSEDLKNFKRITKGHHLLMGRKTFESIGKPLPGRISLVLTRDSNWGFPGVKTVSSYEEAFEVAEASGEDELFIIGGASIYRDSLPYVERLYLSMVDYDGEADTYFDAYEEFLWQTISTNPFEGGVLKVLEKTPTEP